jgi:hypothetical protein
LQIAFYADDCVTFSRNIGLIETRVREKTLFLLQNTLFGNAADSKKRDFLRPGCHESTMYKLLIFVGMTIGGWIGWWLGEQLSDGLAVPFFLSCIGTIAGIVAGWWLAARSEP